MAYEGWKAFDTSRIQPPQLRDLWTDIAPILGVTTQRVSQIVAEREDFPELAKVIGRHRLWRRNDVERWRDAQPRAWAPVE